MNDLDLQAIRERVAAADRGPWFWASVGKSKLASFGTLYGNGEPILISNSLIYGEPANRDLIGHAPTDIRALLDEVMRQTARAEIAEQAARTIVKSFKATLRQRHQDDRLTIPNPDDQRPDGVYAGDTI